MLKKNVDWTQAVNLKLADPFYSNGNAWCVCVFERVCVCVCMHVWICDCEWFDNLKSIYQHMQRLS